MMTLPYPYSSSARFYALRLLPGQEVLSQLRAFAQQQQLHAAWIAGCTGSLTDVALRYGGQENTALLSGKFEVIALNGTLEQSGEPSSSLRFRSTRHDAWRSYDARLYRADHA